MARRLGHESKEENGPERFFMKEVKERASGVVKRDWEPRLIEARSLGQHAQTGAMMGITADGIVCGRFGRRLPEAVRWDQTGWQDLKGVLWNLRTTGVPEPEVNIEAEPGAAEAERARDETQLEGVREKGANFDEASSALASGADVNEDDGIRSKREFFVTKFGVERFGPTAGCPACANATQGISGRHAHNDECR